MNLAKVSLLFYVSLSLFIPGYKAQDRNLGSLRLVNSSGVTFTGRGRLEINLYGQWGTICHDGFGYSEASLACKQLGFRSFTRYGNVATLSYPRASSSTPIWITKLACGASDLTVYSCSRSSGYLCTHSQDVAIECSSPYPTRPSAVRLVATNGATSVHLTAGRVEVFYVGRWGTICDDGFSFSKAAALCHILTGSSAVLAYGTVGSSMLPFDQGLSSSPVWIEGLNCSYSSLNRRYTCTHDGIGIHDCTHSEDIAISCQADGAVRLISSSYTPSTTNPGSSAGRLEIYYNGWWGTVCDDFFSQSDADVVCKQLGYHRASRYGSVGSLRYSRGSGTIWLTNVGCTSSDIFLANCSHSGFGNTLKCSHSEDVAISCIQGSKIISTGTVRLVSSSNPSTTYLGGSAGRLEIYYGGRWGTVCDDGFGQTDADVVCRQLGYNGSRRYGNVGRLGFSRGTGTIWLTNVRCTSSSTSLASCGHSGYGNTQSCSHSEDVAISCSTTTTSTAVIIGGSTAGGIVGFIVICFCFCGLLRLASKSGRSYSSSVPPPHTVVVPNATYPRSAAPQPQAAVFMAANEEVFVVKDEQQSYPQAQTYVGEAPPDYNSAMNYPNANICQ